MRSIETNGDINHLEHIQRSLPEGTDGAEELGTLYSIPSKMVMQRKVERDRRPTAAES